MKLSSLCVGATWPAELLWLVMSDQGYGGQLFSPTWLFFIQSMHVVTFNIILY